MELVLYAEYEELPDYLFDNIFHNSKYCSKIHILTNKVKELYHKALNLHFYNQIEIHDLQVYNNSFINYPEEIKKFRNGFWIKTINRYIAISNFITKKKLNNIFHIENDVLIFTSLQYIYKFIIEEKDKIYFCKDSPKRALGSMLFIPSSATINDLCFFIQRKIETDKIFYNDMQLLGFYDSAKSFPTEPNINGIVDACCFGQSLAGIDPRNGESSRGFVNPDSDFKPELNNFLFLDNNWYYGLSKLHSLHIHSKNLSLYTNGLLKPEQIFTIDRFKNITSYQEIDYCNLKSNDNIYIKTDYQYIFLKNYLHLIKVPVNLWFGNCDNPFICSDICDNPYIQKIYAMNPGIKHPKIIFEGIGLANNLWKHGQKDIFYQIYTETRKWKKTKNLFCSFNPSTFKYRQELTIELESRAIRIEKYPDQEQFWKQMASHKYVLCPRGNGFDTHRFWEALWLGCIPIIINNKYTEEDYSIFLDYLRAKYNFLEIKSNDIKEIGSLLESISKDGI